MGADEKRQPGCCSSPLKVWHGVVFVVLLIGGGLGAYKFSRYRCRGGGAFDPAGIAHTWHDLELVPDVIPEAPIGVVDVEYPSGAHVRLGLELTPTQVQSIPTLSWAAKPGMLYTVIMMDPDAPSRINPENGEARHWIVVNIPATRISEGDTLVEYIGSGAPNGTGLHRYVFLVYEQPAGRLVPRGEDAVLIDRFTATPRFKFRAREFADRYRLGQPPLAGNVFQAQFDVYVPQLHSQLGFTP